MSLSDEKVKNQIQHMIAFIEQEANEKAEEIATKTEEEFTAEKSHIKQFQRIKINDYYKKKHNQIELNKRIQVSNLLNNARLRVLKVREDHVREVLDETQKKLVSLSNVPNEYKKLLEGLISQGLFQLLEDKVEIRCRKKDAPLVQEVIPKAVERYKKAAGKNVAVSINTNNYLNSEIAGGVELSTVDGKIKVINTLESRLELISEQILPQVKEVLFGANQNRKFKD